MRPVEHRLDHYALGIFDGPHATPPESADGPVFLGIDNLTEDGRLALSNARFISEQDFPRWTRRVEPQAGDVVFSYEATLHRYAVIPEGFRGCLGRRLALVRPDPKKLDSKFLLYYFLTPHWRAVAGEATISGATVDRLLLTRVPSLPVSFPELDHQRRIASILSAYDDLIENNNRRIALLE
jgi:type I restriction enzyme S subunit